MLVASLMACGFRTLALARYAQLHSGTSSYFHSSTSSFCFTAAPTITITATHGHAHGAHADPLG
jgi:FPC/CPF motif-containing protein YcgG